MLAAAVEIVCWAGSPALGGLAAVETRTGVNNLEGEIGENERLGVGFAVPSGQDWNAVMHQSLKVCPASKQRAVETNLNLLTLYGIFKVCLFDSEIFTGVYSDTM